MVKTTLAAARSGSESLRITVPQGVVQFLEVKDGDEVDWFKMDSAGERTVTIRKAK